MNRKQSLPRATVAAAFRAAVVLCSTALAAASGTGMAANDRLRGPPPAPSRSGAGESLAAPDEFGRSCCRFWLLAYHRVFARFIRSDCPMEPSCSNYALDAVNRHGAALGTVLTAGRLLHEGDEVRTTRQVWTPKRGWRCVDLVERNTAWRRSVGTELPSFSTAR
jgi:hypothetical protein